jgi:hypothetical protein
VSKKKQIILFTAALLVAIIATIILWTRRPAGEPVTPDPGTTTSSKAPVVGRTGVTAPTRIYAHNLMLRKGPSFRVYVRWLRGQMVRTKKAIDPSFDDPDSFVLDIRTGVLRANMGDIGAFLNAPGGAPSPLKNIVISGQGDQVKITGTLQKLIPIPVEVNGTISVVPENRIRFHVTKLSVVKVPIKSLLGGFHVEIEDLFNGKKINGVEVVKNDIIFDTQEFLPPPHIKGTLSQVRMVSPDLEEVFGDAKEDVERVEQWRNFLRLQGGTIDFGKLTMHQVDLIMIDISNKAWFDLDLAHYQDQLVNGYTRMTPQAGLQIFMPDLSELPTHKANPNISIEWLKNRNTPPPADVKSK